MKIKNLALLGTIFGSSLLLATPAQAGTDEYIGELMLVGFNFCPRGTLQANGQLLAISQNSALFALYGTIYGGDGSTTFALPDLRGRVPMSQGQGPGLSFYQIGQAGGTETNTMTVNQMPPHTHTAGVQTVNAVGTETSPKNNAFASSANATYSDATPSGNYMKRETIQIGLAGGGQPQNNMQPYLTMNYCVVINGIFPSRP